MYDEQLAFQFPARNKIIFGRGRCALLGEEVDGLGASRALILCGTVLVKSSLVERVREVLGKRCVGTFGEIPWHSDVEAVEKAAQMVRHTGADMLVSIGGGSTIDSGKCIAFLLAEGGPLRKLMAEYEIPKTLSDKYQMRPITHPLIAHIALPTTYSCSETNGGLGVADRTRGIKLLMVDPKLAPKVAILDPELTTSLPPHLTAGSGLNALGHCIESMYTKGRHPISDGLALHGIRLISQYLPRCVENGGDLLARGQMQLATVMSGESSANVGVGLNHALGHCVGTRCNVFHGTAHGTTLPYVMAHNMEAATPQLAMIAEAMGVDTYHMSQTEAAMQAIERVRELQAKIGNPQRLRDAGIARSDLQQLAEDTMQDFCIHHNPRPVRDAEQVLALLEEAW